MSQLLEECSLESYVNIEEDILEMEDIIESERREQNNTEDLEASLRKLQEIRTVKNLLEESQLEKVRPMTEEEILRRQLKEELEMLKINEDEFEQKLVDCKKKIKMFTIAKKSPAEIEPHQIM